MLAWLVLLRPHTMGHEQSWDFSAEYLSPRLTKVHFCPQETQSHQTCQEISSFDQSFLSFVLTHQQTFKR